MVAVHAGADADFARRLRKASGADPSELGTTRIAGMTNSKWRHEPDFRIITIARGAPGPHRQPALDEAGLVAAPEALEARRRRAVVQWTLARLRDVRGPRAHNSDDADISRADFTWCMTAID